MSNIAGKCSKHYNSLLLLCFFLWLLLVFREYSAILQGKNGAGHAKPNLFDTKLDQDQCSGRYIYVHNLQSKFNAEILENCSSLIKWSHIDMCRAISNMGLGPEEFNSHGVFSNESWFATHQFLLEPIFHNRMIHHYKCLTNDSSKASAIYVPFYPGLDVGRYLWDFNTSLKDSTSVELFEWLMKTPEWNRKGGKDHFFVVGRTTWDFRRQTNDDSDWGNRLMFLPPAKNITILSIESHDLINKDFAIPYPTYFHPSCDSEVFTWQNKMRRAKRKYLFSFVGAPRIQIQDSVRNEIIEQCLASGTKCKWLDCSSGGKCNSPSHVMKIFQSSTFCLQPRGDSYTRRSAFDAIVAGCIPVFFDPRTAYEQYTWHLPKNYTEYSVFIPSSKIKNGEVEIEKKLSRISKEVVEGTREEVIRLIPQVIYANPLGNLETIEDAFDIAVKGVLDRFSTGNRA